MNQQLATPIPEPEMVSIPGGSFLMGSLRGRSNERPVHRVWLDGFALGKYQVTNRAYHRFVDMTGHPAPPFWQHPNLRAPAQPVVGVNWFDAMAYCEWLSQMTGLTYRLPTEAEWERAARGGLEAKSYPWGDAPPDSIPTSEHRWRHEGPEEVGLYAPNGYGLFNMGDNVHEWCLDWYDPAYYQHSPPRNPAGPNAGNRRASRGGAWRHQIKFSRCSARSSIPPAYRYADYGFRVARVSAAVDRRKHGASPFTC